MRKEAPGLTCKLERVFPAHVIDQLALHYELVKKLGGNSEPHLTREEGVSFNPRIARTVSLLLEQKSQLTISPHLIVAAMWSLVPGADAAQLERMDSQAFEVVSELRSTLATSQQLSVAAATISGVLVLDSVRHLHMTSLTHQERAAALKVIQDEQTVLANSAISDLLRHKLAHAIKLQERSLCGTT